MLRMRAKTNNFMIRCDPEEDAHAFLLVVVVIVVCECEFVLLQLLTR